MTACPPQTDRRGRPRPPGRTTTEASHDERAEAAASDSDRRATRSTRSLEALYLAHAAALRGRLLVLTRDPAAADDLASEAFLRLALELAAGRAPDDARAWLYRVGANLVVSRARRTNVATRAMPGLLERDVAASPEDEAIAHERDDLLHDALDTLAGPDRQVVLLAAQGYRTTEIAGIIGCSGEATRTRLCRARGRLRSRLALVGMTA